MLPESDGCLADLGQHDGDLALSRTPTLRDSQCVRQHDGLIWRSVEANRMLFVDGHAGGKDNGFLSRADEDVAITRAAMEPIWIVERATA